MFVVYTNSFDEEVIITTKKNEQNMLIEYFEGGPGDQGEGDRKLGNYDREEIKGKVIVITPRLNLDIN